MNAMREFIDRLTFGIGKLAMFELVEVDIGIAHDAPGNSNHRRTTGHGPHDHAARADLHMIANADIAEDFGAGANDDAVAQSRVPLARILARAAQRDALVEKHVV